MLKENIKSIMKTALGVVVIYILVVCLSLAACDRMSELESREDIVRHNSSIVLDIK